MSGELERRGACPRLVSCLDCRGSLWLGRLNGLSGLFRLSGHRGRRNSEQQAERDRGKGAIRPNHRGWEYTRDIERPKVKLTVNGEPRDVPEGITLVDLLSLLKIEAEGVAVEVNGEVVRRASRAERQLETGDQLEIVTFVGGG